MLNPKQGEVNTYFQKRIRDTSLSKTTIIAEVNDLRLFWNGYLELGIKLLPLKTPPEKDVWIPTDQEVIRIMKAAEHSSADKGIALRNSLITRMFFLGCMRVGEMMRIRLNDVDFELGGVNIRSEKGEADRFVGFHPDILKDLKT
ncbi:hypothetical protein IX51_06935 [uncultured archaeon]|nr:hypothetical protein IX51_06935 [uncultured archaeon]